MWVRVWAREKERETDGVFIVKVTCYNSTFLTLCKYLLTNLTWKKPIKATGSTRNKNPHWWTRSHSVTEVWQAYTVSQVHNAVSPLNSNLLSQTDGENFRERRKRHCSPSGTHSSSLVSKMTHFNYLWFSAEQVSFTRALQWCLRWCKTIQFNKWQSIVVNKNVNFVPFLPLLSIYI